MLYVSIHLGCFFLIFFYNILECLYKLREHVLSGSHIVSSDHSFNLLSTYRTSRNGLICWLIEDGPRCAGLTHDPMAAIQEYCVDFSSETDVTIVKCFLFLLKQVCQFIDLLLEHYYFLSKESIVLPFYLRVASTIDRLKNKKLSLIVMICNEYLLGLMVLFASCRLPMMKMDGSAAPIIKSLQCPSSRVKLYDRDRLVGCHRTHQRHTLYY